MGNCSLGTWKLLSIICYRIAMNSETLSWFWTDFSWFDSLSLATSNFGLMTVACHCCNCCCKIVLVCVWEIKPSILEVSISLVIETSRSSSDSSWREAFPLAFKNPIWGGAPNSPPFPDLRFDDVLLRSSASRSEIGLTFVVCNFELVDSGAIH